MNIIDKYNIGKKILISIIVVILLFNFIFPVKSHADSIDWVGPLFTPIQTVVSGIGDAIFNFLQPTFIDGAPKAVYKTTRQKLEEGIGPAGGFVFGWMWDGLQSLFDAGYNRTVTEGIGDFVDDTVDNMEYQRKEIVFPSIYYSIENIFANKIPAFDVNFINPSVEMPQITDNAKSEEEREKITEFLKQNETKDDLYFEDIKAAFYDAMIEIANTSEYNLLAYDSNYSNPSKKAENYSLLSDKEQWVSRMSVYYQENWTNVDWTRGYSEAYELRN